MRPGDELHSAVTHPPPVARHPGACAEADLPCLRRGESPAVPPRALHAAWASPPPAVNTCVHPAQPFLWSSSPLPVAYAAPFPACGYVPPSIPVAFLPYASAPTPWSTIMPASAAPLERCGAAPLSHCGRSALPAAVECEGPHWRHSEQRPGLRASSTAPPAMATQCECNHIIPQPPHDCSAQSEACEEVCTEMGLAAPSSPSARASRSPSSSPRLRSITEYFALRALPPYIRRCEQLIAAADADLGPQALAVREYAMYELSRSPPKPVTQPVQGPPLAAIVPAAPAPSDLVTVARPAAASSASAGAENRLERRTHLAVGDQRCAPIDIRLASRNLASEDKAICSAVDELLDCVPRSLLFASRSLLPEERRIAARRRHLLQQGVTSIKSAARCVRAWVAFCAREHLPGYGVGADGQVDADLLRAFLASEDERARERARGRRGGATIEHSLAVAARWLHTHLELPFAHACVPSIRRFSLPATEAEPGWAQMWEIGVVRHLFCLAVSYGGPRQHLIRALAAVTYIVCVASIRLIDAQRSAVPVVRADGSVSGVAVVSKGRRRSSMRPKPWWAVLDSPHPAFSNEVARLEIAAALHSIPSECCSMLPNLLTAAGHAAPLQHAVRFDPTQRMSKARLVTSVAWLLMLPPLRLPRCEARAIVQRQHGPRHVLPEVARVVGWPEAARNEIGMWADGGQRRRMGSMSNRYSREGEAVLQISLRRQLLAWIRSRAPDVPRPALQSFAAQPADMRPLAATATTAVTIARGSVTSGEGHVLQ